MGKSFKRSRGDWIMDEAKVRGALRLVKRGRITIDQITDEDIRNEVESRLNNE